MQHTAPIEFTAHTCSQMHHFQYIIVKYLALYISYAYWHPQNLLVNKFNWVTYSVYTFIYVCVYHIKINKIILLTCYWIFYILYSYMWLLWCSCVLYCFNWFDFVHKPTDLSYFPLLCTLCLITCVGGGERKVLLLCSVMSAVQSLSKTA
jgi:hypothetical protein